jgi:hypothetical protein
VGYVAENFTHLDLFPANLEDKERISFQQTLEISATSMVKDYTGRFPTVD